MVQAIALDLDGTITTHGQVLPAVLSAIDECRAEGTAVILVTGRIEAELHACFPDLRRHFDAVIYENGAVADAGDGQWPPLAPPVDAGLADALRGRGVDLRVGKAIIACHSRDAGIVLEESERLGLDQSVVRNRAELMVMPAGVTKGTGLLQALEHLGVSARNTIAIGDAENDLAMLAVAEIAVAPANAIASVREHADLVLDGEGGDAVAAFLLGPVVSGAKVLPVARRAITIGHLARGAPVTVPGAQSTVLVQGGSGSGKSYLGGLLIERWAAAGYTVLVIDPEGDYASLGRLRRVVVIDAATQPDSQELMDLLVQEQVCVVLDLSRCDRDRAEVLVQQVAAHVEAARSLRGVPHWIVIDEAHGPLGADGSLVHLFRPSGGGHCYLTYRPEDLCPAVSSTVDVTLTALGRAPAGASAGGAEGAAGGRVAGGRLTGRVAGERVAGEGVAAGRGLGQRPGRGAQALFRATGQPELTFEVDRRLTPHVRHRHKYRSVALAVQHQFVFRDGRGEPLARAATLEEFTDRLTTVPDSTIQHHVANGDFSRWAVAALQDRELAALIGGAENELNARVAAGLIRFRAAVEQELRIRYLGQS